MNAKVFGLVCLVCVAAALPVDQYGPIKHEKKEPKPYSFSYGVQDDYNGNVFGQNEQSDGQLVEGSYTVNLPDGRKQTVTYKADHYNGFIADVSYYGEAQYPPKSKYPPFVVENKHPHPEPTHYKPEQPKFHPHPEPVRHPHPEIPVYRPSH